MTIPSHRWQRLLAKSVTSPQALADRLGIDPAPLAAVVARYPMRINPYYLELIERHGEPLLRQAVPDPRELTDATCVEDPLNEENLSPVPNLVHKYPDRALFLVTSRCAMYCRFCTRKRKVGTTRMQITKETIARGLEYLRQTPAIREVLVSGGDPLLLDDETLAWLLAELRRIKSIEIIRIGSRVPCTLPMRVTAGLAKTLKKFHPLYINTHFNHPAELTPAATTACARLADAGIPLGNQAVLLAGINDDPETIRTLMLGLLAMRVKPYYLFQADMTRGTDHFRTPIETGLGIMRALIGHTSGMAIPTLAVDAPGGGGKIPLLPDYVRALGETLVFSNYQGITCTYHNAA